MVQVYLIDFGISGKVRVKRDKNKVEESKTGSLGAMAPERVLGLKTANTFESDTYSFGVLLYKMLTSKLPFTTDEEDFEYYSYPKLYPTSIKLLRLINNCLIYKAS